MEQALTFTGLLKYVHSLDVKICEPRGTWSQFLAVENGWGRVGEILNTNPEDRYRLQVLSGMLRWYRLKLIKRNEPTASWRYPTTESITVGVLADNDQEFLETIAYYIVEHTDIITIAQHEELKHG